MSLDLPAHARKVSSWCLGCDMYALKKESPPRAPIRSRASAWLGLGLGLGLGLELGLGPGLRLG